MAGYWGYAASRSRERDTALVCENGHELTGHLEELNSPPRHCERCGAATMSACKSCGSRILGDWPNVRDLTGSPPSPYCSACGQPHRWHATAVERARRLAEIQIELHNLDARTAAQLNEFAVAVADNTATPAEAEIFGKLFKKKAGIEAAKAVGGFLKGVASGLVADAIRKTMLGG